jgi:hypothetical protein
MFGFKAFENGPVLIAGCIDQPGDDPDGVFDPLGTDGLHAGEDRSEAGLLPIGPKAICRWRGQRPASRLAGAAGAGPRRQPGWS